MIQYTLPIEPMLQKVVHVFYTHNKISPVYGKYLLHTIHSVKKKSLKIVLTIFREINAISAAKIKL